MNNLKDSRWLEEEEEEEEAVEVKIKKAKGIWWRLFVFERWD